MEPILYIEIVTIIGKHYRKGIINQSGQIEEEVRRISLKFQGKDGMLIQKERTEGVFKWKLRKPLREAIENLEKKGVFRDMQTAVTYDHNMILYGPPGTGKTYYTVIYAVAIAEKRPFEEVEREAKTD